MGIFFNKEKFEENKRKENNLIENKEAIKNIINYIPILEELYAICFDKGKTPNKDNTIVFHLYRNDVPKHSERRIKVNNLSKEGLRDKEQFVIYFDDNELKVKDRNKFKSGISYYDEKVKILKGENKKKLAQFSHEVMQPVVDCYNGKYTEEETIKRIAKKYKSADIYKFNKAKNGVGTFSDINESYMNNDIDIYIWEDEKEEWK